MSLAGRRRFLRPGAAAVTLVTVALLAGCSSSGGSGDSRQAVDCRAPGVTDSEVTAGLLLSDSGPVAATLRGFRAGVEARLGVVNAAGGVHGRKVLYKWQDDASQVSLNLRGAQQLVERERVFGVVLGPTAASGSAGYLDQAGVPATGMAAELAWADHPNMFSWHYFQSHLGSTSVWGDYIRAAGGSRVAIVDMELNESAQNFREMLSSSLRSAGLEVPVITEISTEAGGYAALVDRLRAARVDTIVGALLPDALAQILPTAHAAGLALRAVVPLGYDPTLLTQLGPELAGTTIYLNFSPFELNTPAHQQLLAALNTYAPYAQPRQQESSVYGWLSADLFLRGLEAAGSCPTRQAFIDGLRAVRDYDGGGLLPAPVNLSTNRGRITNCYSFVQVSPDGTQFVPLQPTTRCGNPLT